MEEIAEQTNGNGESARTARALMMAGVFLLLAVLCIFAVRRVVGGDHVLFAAPGGIKAWQLYLGVAGALALAGFLIRLWSARAFFEIFFSAAIFFGAWAFAWFILPWDAALLLASALTILQARVRRVGVHNAFMLVGCAGLAIHLAVLFSMKTLAGVLLAFLLYDLFHGRVGGAVVASVRAALRRGLVPGVIIPVSPRGAFERVGSVISAPDAVFLGAGDFILPATLIVRAALSGVGQSLAVAFGVVLAAFLLGSRSSLKPVPGLAWLLPGAVVPYVILLMLKMV